MNAGQNPYVGPRPFYLNDRDLFFGREREARDLLASVVSQRLTLFYAQSGAGKSSLVNTRLIPQLSEMGFGVLPIGRISGDLPQGVAEVDNIFLFNLMLHLDESARDPNRFARLSLSEFLAHLVSEDGKTYHYDPDAASLITKLENEAEKPYEPVPYVLVIDQFEEILTTHQDCWQDRAGFFREINQAMLDDPQLWVVLTLREDYVAALTPFTIEMQDRMRGRFYMQRMDADAALEAIKRPAEKMGRPFAPGAAEKLRDNLRQVRVQQADGGYVTADGQFVEPVQLQVVCYQLWEDLADEQGEQITDEDLLRVAKGADLAEFVDQALGNFYEEAIRRALTDATVPVTEQALREWFSSRLITEAETRGLVYQGEKETGGLPNDVVRLLEGYLIRAEMRAGGKWYELVHDRFIEPILSSNLAWQTRRTQDSPLAQAAKDWEESGKVNQYLATGTLLQRALSMAETDPAGQDSLVQEFLEASKNMQQQLDLAEARREARTAQTLRWLAVGLILALAAAIFFAIRSFNQAQLAKQQAGLAGEQAAMAQAAEKLASERAITAQAAESNERLAKETAVRDKNDALNARITAEAAKVSAEQARATAVAAQAEVQSLSLARFAQDAMTEDPELALALAIHANRIAIVASATPAPPVQEALLEAAYQSRTQRSFNEGGPVNAVAYASEPQRALAAGGSPVPCAAEPCGGLTLWDWRGDVKRIPLAGHTDTVWAAAITPDGRRGLSGGAGGQIIYWDLDSGEAIEALQSQQGTVWSVAFNPVDPSQALSAGSDGKVKLWDLAAGRVLQEFTGHDDWVYAVAFSPDGRRALSGSEDQTAILWDVESGEALLRLGSQEPDEPGHHDWVRAVAFSPCAGPPDATAGRCESNTALTASQEILLWDLTTGDLLQRFDPASDATIYGLAFSPDGDQFLSASDQLLLWDLETASPQMELEGHDGRVRSAAFGADPWTALSGALDGTVRLWDLRAGQQVATLNEQEPTGFPTDIPQECDGNYAYGPIDVGSVVILGRHRAVNGETNWESGMDAYVGKPALVTQLYGPDYMGCPAVYVDIDSGFYDWRIRDLQLAQPLRSLALSPCVSSPEAPDGRCGGRQAVSGSEDGAMVLWEVRTGQPLQRFPGQDVAVTAVTFVSETVILAGGADGSLTWWDAETGQRLDDESATGTNQPEQAGGEPGGRPNARQMPDILALRALPDGRQILVGDSDGQIFRLDRQSGAREVLIPGITEGAIRVTSLDFNPDGTLALIGTNQGRFVLNNLDKKTATSILCGTETATVRDVAFSLDGRRLACLADNTVTIWTLRENEELQNQGDYTLAGLGSIWQIVEDGAGRLFAGLGDGQIRVWDTETNRPLYAFGADLPVAFEPDGSGVLAAAEAGGLLGWEIASSQTMSPAPSAPIPAGDALVSAIETTPAAGNRVLVADYDGNLLLVDLDTQQIVQQWQGNGEPIYALAANQTLDMAATIDAAGNLAIWDSAQSQPVRVISNTVAPLSVAMSADGSRVLTGHEDGSLVFRDLAADTVQTTAGRGSRVLSVALQGSTALSGDADGNLTFWELRTEPTLRRQARQQGAVQDVTLSADGRLALSGASDGSMVLWDVATGEAVTRFGHRSPVTQVRLSQDELKALSRTGDGEIHVWQLHPPAGELSTMASARYIEPLACQTWREQYDVIQPPADCLAQVAITATPTPAAGPKRVEMDLARLNQPNSAILAAGTRDVWRYQGKAEEVLSVDVEAWRPANTVSESAQRLERGKLDVQVQVLMPDGMVLGESEDRGSDDTNARLGLLILPEDGDYVIEVGSRDLNSSGAYTLTVAPPPQIALGEAVQGIVPLGGRETWVFQGQSGDMVSIILEEDGSGIDPVVELLDQKGQLLTSNDDWEGYNSRIDKYILPYTGIYMLVARTFGDSTSGAYRLSLLPVASQPLALNSPVEGNLADEAIWTFGGAEGQVISIVYTDGGQGSYFNLMNGLGEILGQEHIRTTDHGSVLPRYRLPISDTYVIEPAVLNVPGVYTLTVSDALSQTIALSETVRSNIEDYVSWRFEGQAGRMMRITIKADGSEIQPGLEVRDGAENIVGQVEPAQAEAQTTVVLPVAGAYSIVPFAYQSSGGYLLTLREVISQTIDLDEPIRGRIEDARIWAFEGEAGEALRISLADDGSGIDVRLKVIAPNGVVLAQDDDSGTGTNALLAYLPLPVDGVYTIMPEAYGPTGAYSLSVSSPVSGTITLGGTVRGEVADSRVWVFYSDAAQPVRVSVTSAEGDIDTSVKVLDPDGDSLQEVDDYADNPDALIPLLFLPAAGNYAIVPGAIEETGSYSLTLSAPSTATLPFDEEQEATTDSSLVWVFEGRDGQVVTIDMMAAGEMDPYLTLLAPDGSVLAEDDDSGPGSLDARIRVGLLADGQYMLLPKDLYGRSGRYALRLAEETVSPGEVEQLMGSAFLAMARNLAERNQLDAALDALEQATSLTGADSATLSQICRFGGLWNRAVDVLDLCEEAVSLAPEDPTTRESRGLVRALAGDFAGAIEDFRFVVQYWQETGDYEFLNGAWRESWIADLQAGRNPFDAITLRALRVQ